MKYPMAGDLVAKTGSAVISNPCYQTNPPWVTDLVAGYYDILEAKVPPAWLPKLEDVRTSRSRKSLTAHVNELGCGAYGCVLPTLDPKVVLKITTDETETHFAATWSDKLVAPVVVKYYMVVSLSERHDGRPVNLLWRQSAEHVGGAGAVLGKDADSWIDAQAMLAGAAFSAVYHHEPADVVATKVDQWLLALDQMAKDKRWPELAKLFGDVAKVYRKQHLLFGDIHAGNVGLVDGKWVVVDPGNISVVPPS